ncbi:MAG: ATP-binding protein [Deltaproteobacteria bacterium]
MSPSEFARLLVDASPVGLVVLDDGGVIAFANPRAHVLLDRMKLVGTALLTLIEPADANAQLEPSDAAVDVRLAALPERWLSLRFGAGRTVTLDDVSERKRFERALCDANDRFEAFMDAGSVISWMKDANGRYVYANEACAVERGVTKDGVLGHTTRELGATATNEDALDRAVLDSGIPSTTTDLGRDDRAWQVARFLFWDSTGERYTGGLGVDITAQRTAEEALFQTQAQLRHAQKMEAVGRLAGGVAHDFNNLLTVILSCTALARADSARATALDEIETAAHRAAQLTRQLLSFSRRQNVEPKVVDLGELVTETRTMLMRLLGEDVEVVITIADHVAPVFADPGCLVQILLNLAVNARDAMPRGGKISIDVSEHGPRVRLAFSDTGHGMAAELQTKIFEPFFTTKAPGVGTGLGLATVFGIVEQAGGEIAVRSELAVGTTFTIDLPRASGAVTTRREPKPQPARGHETILVVEDDAPLLELASAVLEAEGYRVLVASSAADALRLAEDHPGRIDLLLTDVVMPHVSGVELWRQLAAARENLKVLWMSGYGEDNMRRHGLDSVSAQFVQKPFTPSILAERLRAALDR